MENGPATHVDECRFTVKTKGNIEHEILIETREEESVKQHIIKTIALKDDHPDSHVAYSRVSEEQFLEEDEIVAVNGVLIADSDLVFLVQMLKGELVSFLEEEYVFIVRRKRKEIHDSIEYDYFEIIVTIVIGRGIGEDFLLLIKNFKNITLSMLDLSLVKEVKFHDTENKQIYFPMAKSYLKVTKENNVKKLDLGRLDVQKDTAFEFWIHRYDVTKVLYKESDKECETLSSVYVLQNTSTRCFINSEVTTKSVGLKSCYEDISYRDWKKPDSRFFIIIDKEDGSCFFESVKSRGLFLGFHNGSLQLLTRRELRWKKDAYPPECVLFKRYPF